MEPPVTVISPSAKSDDASDSVNVSVSVWPDFSDPKPARVIVTVGAVVSMVTTCAVVLVCVSVIPSSVVVDVERILYSPGESWAVLQVVHLPVVESAVHGDPELVHVPVVESVSVTELAVATES